MASKDSEWVFWDSNKRLELEKLAMPEPGQPYADWDGCMSRQPPNLRYISLTYRENKGDYEDELGQDHIPEFALCRWFANKKVLNYMDGQGLSPADLSEKTGIDRSLISRMRTYSRPFGIPPSKWEILSYDVMHTTMNELLFGDRRPITLPVKYSIPAELMLKYLSDEEIKKLTESIRTRRKIYCKLPANGNHHRPFAVLFRERLRDMLDENGYFEMNCFGAEDDGTETPNVMKSTLFRFWTVPSLEPKSGMIFYAALYYRDTLNLDWFTCEDPLRYNDAYIQSENGDRIELTGDAKAFWRYLLSLDTEQREYFMSVVWAKIFPYIL